MLEITLLIFKEGQVYEHSVIMLYCGFIVITIHKG
jgi:hypothetical protein